MSLSRVCLLGLVIPASASATCPTPGVDYYVQAGTSMPGMSMPDLTTVIADMTATSRTSAVVSVPSTEAASPRRARAGPTRTPSPSPADGLEIIADDPVCWQGSGTTAPAIGFNGAGASSITGFATISCPGNGALYVKNTSANPHRHDVRFRWHDHGCVHRDRRVQCADRGCRGRGHLWTSVAYQETTIGVDPYRRNDRG